jgi:hypothetical protein
MTGAPMLCPGARPVAGSYRDTTSCQGNTLCHRSCPTLDPLTKPICWPHLGVTDPRLRGR